MKYDSLNESMINVANLDLQTNIDHGCIVLIY